MTEQVLLNPATGAMLEVPKDYASYGVECSFAPPDPKTVCMMVLAFSGGGKTTLCSSIPGGIILSFQKNAASCVMAPKAARCVVDSWDKYFNLANKLVADRKAGRCPFQTICIDTGDEWFDVCAEKVIKDYNDVYKRNVANIGDVGAEGKGYGETANLMYDEIKRLQFAGFGVIITLHLMEKTITRDKEKLTVVRPVLSPSAYKSLQQLTRVKAQLVSVTQTTQIVRKTIPGTDRTIETTLSLPPDKWTSEYRLMLKSQATDDEIKATLPNLPPYITVGLHDGWANLEAAWSQAVAKGQAEHDRLTGKVPASVPVPQPISK